MWCVGRQASTLLLLSVCCVEMTTNVEHFLTRCELSCMMQELIGSYIMMEEYFMRQMVVKVWYVSHLVAQLVSN